MKKHFASFEDVIADEDFFAWYNNTDADKAQAWQVWLAAHPEDHPLVEEAIRCLNEIKVIEANVPIGQTEAAHSRLMQAVNVPEIEVPVKQMQSRRTWVWMAAAAVVLAVLVGGYRLLFPQAERLTLAAPYGQLSKHTLSDGSVVTLNAASKITFDKNWKKGQTREVWLDGEAFFEVAKTAAKTGFIVHGKGMDVVVTGTKFNVINRGAEQSILLTEGSVTLKTEKGQEVRMTPGEFVQLTNTAPEKALSAPQEKLLAWKDAKLVFDNDTMTEVAAVIKRHYGVDVQLTAGVTDNVITGILPNNNLDALLDALATAKGFRITRTKEGIIISNASIL